METLKAVLAAWGIGMNIIHNADSKAKGVVFTYDSLYFAWHLVKRSMTYAKLCQRMGTDKRLQKTPPFPLRTTEWSNLIHLLKNCTQA